MLWRRHEGLIERAIKMNKLTSVEQVTNYTKAGGGCLTCFDKLEEILAQTNAELVAEGILAEHEAYRVGAAQSEEAEGTGQGRQGSPAGADENLPAQAVVSNPAAVGWPYELAEDPAEMKRS